jgi:hypothetical protein
LDARRFYWNGDRGVMAYVEYNGKEYDARHGGPFDRGAADSYYGRPSKPHFYTGATNQSQLVPVYGMSDSAIAEYHAGYDYNEMMGDKKEW